MAAIRRRAMLQVLVGFPALGSLTRAQVAEPSIVETRGGKWRGRYEAGTHIFKGIRYGDDTRARRFLPPVAPQPWTGVRDALEFGPIAPQTSSGGRPISEDCLHLNVWTPALREGRRPVMVWFHGGAYSSGTSNERETDGARLSRRGDVVVVTVNHRLNAFGYLYLAEFGGPDLADSGNLGQLDLILALEWVRDNIAAFGGDARNVTIFGHSGGGAKAATLMAMPKARGLFHRVSTHSGQQVTASRTTTASANARSLITALGLDPAHAVNRLRELPMEQLVKVSRAPAYLGPVKDGRSLPRDPFDPDAPPLSADIPMILGNTKGETRTLIGRGDPTLFSLTWDTLHAKLEANSPFMGSLNRAEVIAKYREWHPDYSPADVFFAATTDSRSWRGQVIEADRRAAQPATAAPTYVFQFDWATPIDGGKWGAHHGLDVPFIFDNVAITPHLVGSGAEQQQLASRMSDAWVAFARTGRPHTASIPAWPAFDLLRRATMVFDRDVRVVDDPRGNERRLFGQVPYVQPGT